MPRTFSLVRSPDMVGMDSHGRNDGAKPASAVGRLGLSLFFLIVLALGSFWGWLVVREFGRAMGQRLWAKTPCTIVSSKVREQGHADSPFASVVSYRYELAGRETIRQEITLSPTGREIVLGNMGPTGPISPMRPAAESENWSARKVPE
jgi:hypothetical protein